MRNRITEMERKMPRLWCVEHYVRGKVRPNVTTILHPVWLRSRCSPSRLKTLKISQSKRMCAFTPVSASLTAPSAAESFPDHSVLIGGDPGIGKVNNTPSDMRVSGQDRKRFFMYRARNRKAMYKAAC